MARGKIVIKRIENDTTREVTFCKRRGGVFKKAYELSVLCDAEIAVIIFSKRGRLHEYASSNMKSTIDKYKEATSSESYACTPEEINAKFYQKEAEKLRKQIDTLQISIRHFKGEGLDSLKLKELKQLETRLERGISRMRSMKHEKILAEIESMQKRIAENDRVLKQEEDDAGYRAIEAYLATSALQIKGPLEGIPATISPNMSLNIMGPLEGTSATLSPNMPLNIMEPLEGTPTTLFSNMRLW